jgi:hypothetical protein
MGAGPSPRALTRARGAGMTPFVTIVIPTKVGTQYTVPADDETRMGAGLSPRAPWRALAAPA